MSGAQISADVAHPGRRVRAGLLMMFHGPTSAGDRLMFRLSAVAAPTRPTLDSTTVGSAKPRWYSSGAGMSTRLEARASDPAVEPVVIVSGSSSARAPRTATAVTDQA